MSKGPDGPSAQSFENPRKVGWLHKHGGSGMSSHWKKRWFIVDHHYLFYFKGPNDKKPVGILCLPEYQSCHKADNKESKKPNSFVLDRGLADESDGRTKNYVLHADSETDMKSWIAATREEMKPILGESGFSSHSKNTPKPKIDQKAFDEVTAIASEGPKLTHPTASRPKPRGRRPPKRYAVFHEDDSKDDDSPTITPSSSSTSLSTKPLPPSPSSTPNSSPKTPNKGSHPSAPILPKVHMTPPTKPRTAMEPVESGSSSPKASAKPEPPKKVPSKDRQDSVPSPESPRTEPKAAPKPSTRPPTLPKKPTAAAITVEPPVQVEVSSEPMSEPKPMPNIRPKPTPPRAKPRTSTVPSSIELSEAANSTEVVPAQPPQVKPRRSTSPEAAVIPAPIPIPVKKPRPVPVPRKPDVPVARKPEVPVARKPEVPVARKPEVPKPSIVNPPSVEDEKLQDTEPVEDKEVEDEVNKKDEQVESVVEESLITSNGIVQEEVEDEKEKIERKEDKEEENGDASRRNGEVDDAVEADQSHRKSSYENVVLSNGKEDTEVEQRKEGRENYEDMSYEAKKEAPKLDSDETEDDQNQSAYVEMSPGVMGNAEDAGQEKSGDYEQVEIVEDDSDSKNDYEMPQWIDQDITSARSSGGFVPMSLTSNLQDEETAIYDVPPPPRPAYDDRPASTATSDSLMASQSQEAGSRSNSVTSSASLSSKNSSDVVSLQARRESKGKASQPVVIIASEPTPNLEQRMESLEDSIGKAESSQSNGIEKPSDPSNFYDIREAETVGKALQQAKEILRLAKAAKAEADQIKKESTRELELAKRERHDASLMKKNAAEILRIAKVKLGK